MLRKNSLSLISSEPGDPGRRRKRKRDDISRKMAARVLVPVPAGDYGAASAMMEDGRLAVSLQAPAMHRRRRVALESVEGVAQRWLLRAMDVPPQRASPAQLLSILTAGEARRSAIAFQCSDDYASRFTLGVEPRSPPPSSSRRRSSSRTADGCVVGLLPYEKDSELQYAFFTSGNARTYVTADFENDPPVRRRRRSGGGGIVAAAATTAPLP